MPDPQPYTMTLSRAFPALIFLSVRPRSAGDRARLTTGLEQLRVEDPTLEVVSDEAMPFIVGAQGERHLEIVCDRLAREFGVDAELGTPIIAYRETITRDAEIDFTLGPPSYPGRHVRVVLRVSPTEMFKGGFADVSAPRARPLPDAFVGAVRAGVEHVLEQGAIGRRLNGAPHATILYPIDGVRVELLDGEYQDGSSIDDFKTAAYRALTDAIRNAAPTLFEPIMRVRLRVPDVYADACAADLSTRGAVTVSRERSEGWSAISALAPMAGLLGCSSYLTSLTAGKCSITTQFAHYQRRAPEASTDDGAVVRAPLRPRVPLKTMSVELDEPAESL